jgi:hypothetical protein
MRVAASETPELPVPTLPEYPNTSPPEPSGLRYSARVALSCERGHAPGQVLHALQELRQVIDDRLRDDLGGRYDRHSAQSVGTDKLTVTSPFAQQLTRTPFDRLDWRPGLSPSSSPTTRPPSTSPASSFALCRAPTRLLETLGLPRKAGVSSALARTTAIRPERA